MMRESIPVAGGRVVFAEAPNGPAWSNPGETPRHRTWVRRDGLPCPSNPDGPFGEAGPTAVRRPGILVADDDAAVRELMHVVLEQQGFAVWAAADGLQALQLYHEHGAEIDLVLLDVQMPGLDGPQTWTDLQRLNPALSCCFMTGNAGYYTQEELTARGAVRVFQKPFGPLDVAQFLWQMVTPSHGDARETGASNSYHEGVAEVLPG